MKSTCSTLAIAATALCVSASAFAQTTTETTITPTHKKKHKVMKVEVNSTAKSDTGKCKAFVFSIDGTELKEDMAKLKKDLKDMEFNVEDLSKNMKVRTKIVVKEGDSVITREFGSPEEGEINVEILGDDDDVVINGNGKDSDRQVHVFKFKTNDNDEKDGEIEQEITINGCDEFPDLKELGNMPRMHKRMMFMCDTADVKEFKMPKIYSKEYDGDDVDMKELEQEINKMKDSTGKFRGRVMIIGENGAMFPHRMSRLKAEGNFLMPSMPNLPKMLKFNFDKKLKKKTESLDKSMMNETPSDSKSTLAVNDLSVYPNPNGGKFMVKFDLPNSGSTEISVSNLSGQTVFREKMGNFSGFYSKEIDLTNEAKGAYIVQIMQDGKSITKKIVIE